MLTPYVRIFRVPGSLAFVSAGFVSRMPMSMSSLAVVLLISQRTKEYAVAGVLTAMGALVSSVIAPRWSALSDRRGQSWVLKRNVPLYIASMIAFIALVEFNAPKWTWFVAWFVNAVGWNQTGAMIRRRWHHLLGEDKDALHTAWSLESVLDEVVFIIGPVLATLLATQVHPAGGLIAVIILITVGVLWLLTLSETEPPIKDPAENYSVGPILRIPGVLPVLATMFCLGAYFISVELVTVAYATEEGHRGLTGLVLATWSLSSGLSGILFGAIKWKGHTLDRFVIAVAVLAILTLPLLFIDNLVLFTISLFLQGWAISPSIIAGYSVVERLVAEDRVTEAISWATTGIVIGAAFAGAVVGKVIDEVGAQRSFALAVAAAVLGMVSVGATRGPIRRRIPA